MSILIWAGALLYSQFVIDSLKTLFWNFKGQDGKTTVILQLKISSEKIFLSSSL